MTKRTCFLLLTAAGLISVRAQTNVIESQSNWLYTTNDLLFVGDQQNLPATSAWFTGTKAAVLGVTNAAGTATNLVAYVGYGSGSQTIYTYFAPTLANTNQPSPFTTEAVIGGPVQLAPNETIQATVGFYTLGTASQNFNRSLRFALLYAGTNANLTGGGNGLNNYLTGYGQNMNFGTTFGMAPLQTFADTNRVDGKAQLSTTAELAQIGGNGGGNTNDPAFVDNTSYQLVFSVTEINPTNVSITTTFYGSTFANQSNITQTVTDTNFCYTNFDEFILRPALAAQTATNITITSFQVVTYMTAPPMDTNASLSSLVINPAGSLTPAFGPDQLGYTAIEPYGAAPTVTAATSDPNATMKVIYDSITNTLASGMASAPLSLGSNPAAANLVEVEVTAPDGVTVRDYLVSLTQLPSQTVPSLQFTRLAGQLNFSWPLSHLGYRLLLQTNNLAHGVSTNLSDWGTVPGSTGTNVLALPINPGQTDEFYQLVYP